jgi:regulator of ribonuclease activity A
MECCMSFATCDICDANEDKLKLFEDNALVRSTLETPGNGRVLVVDGGGSLRSALVGGNLGELAEKNGWAGIIVFGCVRDSEELDARDIGIRALATHPQRSAKKGVGERDIRVAIAGVAVAPGDWIYADADGVLVSVEPLA